MAQRGVGHFPPVSAPCCLMAPHPLPPPVTTSGPRGRRGGGGWSTVTLSDMNRRLSKHTKLIPQGKSEPQSTYLYKRWNMVSVSAHSAWAYTATLLVMVNVMKGGGRAPPTLTSPGNFTLMTECTTESRRYYSVYSVVWTIEFYSREDWDIRRGSALILQSSSHLSMGRYKQPKDSRTFLTNPLDFKSLKRVGQ